MLDFQVLTPTPAAPLRKASLPTTQPPSSSSSTERRDSLFLVLTHEPEAPTAPTRRYSTFLVLSPVQSDSYPKAPTRVNPILAPSSELSVSPGSSPLLSPTAGAIPVEPRARRRTSTSSSGSSSDGKPRFLKLNPVHWGGEEGEDDYAIEE